MTIVLHVRFWAAGGLVCRGSDVPSIIFNRDHTLHERISIHLNQAVRYRAIWIMDGWLISLWFDFFPCLVIWMVFGPNRIRFHVILLAISLIFYAVTISLYVSLLECDIRCSVIESTSFVWYNVIKHTNSTQSQSAPVWQSCFCCDLIFFSLLNIRFWTRRMACAPSSNQHTTVGL